MSNVHFHQMNSQFPNDQDEHFAQLKLKQKQEVSQ